MAGIGASINVEVKGTSKVDRIIGKVSQLDAIIQKLSSTPLDLSLKKATNDLDSFETELKALQATIKNSEKAIDSAGGAIDSYVTQIASAQSKLNKLNPNTKAYNQVLEKQQKAIRGLAQAQGELAKAESLLESSRSGVGTARVQVAQARAAKRASEVINTLADDYLRLGQAQERGASGKVLTRQLGSTIAQISAQAEALKLVASNSRIASSEFNRFTIAAQAAGQQAFEAKQKQLKASAFGLSSAAPKVNVGVGGESSIAGARNLVSSLVGSYGQIVKSEAALSSYAEQLRAIQALVPYTSNEFRALEEVITSVNDELSKVGLRGQKSAIQTLSGPATDLGSLKAFKERESYQKRVSDELAKQAGIEDRINRASLGETQKLELRNRLEEAASALADDQLLTAQRITREIDRQRMSMERASRAQKAQTQVFGAIGTGFSPISGELPSTVTPGGQKVRNLIPGSPAARLEEAKASRESTEAAVALAKQKLKAVDQEAEELRRGTQAATALGQQKLKALEEERRRLQDETRAAVSLAQQKMREEEKAVADAWKMRGGPALPPGSGVRGGTTRGGESLGLDAPRRLRSTLASGAIIEQGLINLQGKGVDVTSELLSLQNSLNNAKKQDYAITQNNLDALTEQVSLAGKFASLQKQILAGESKGSRSTLSKGGFRPALSASEAREEISTIVSGFNKATSGSKGIGSNITSTLAEDLGKGAARSAEAATAFAQAALGAIKKVFGIASPSRVMQEIAKNLVSSFVVEIVSAASSVAAAIDKTFGKKNLGPGFADIASLPSRAPRSFDVGVAPNVFRRFGETSSSTTGMRGQTSPLFKAGSSPRFDAPGSGYPFFPSYNLATTRFPGDDTPKEISQKRNRPTDASRVLLESIKEYRSAVDNFWEGEDSQFEAVTRVVSSSARLAAARLARRLQQTKDLNPEQQFKQTAGEARSLLSAGRQSSVSSFAGTAKEFILGDRQFGVSQAVGKTVQRISDSVLNSIESLGLSIGNSFEDGIDRIRSRASALASRVDEFVKYLAVDYGYDEVFDSGTGGGGGRSRGGGNAGASPAGGGPQSIDDLQEALGLGNLSPIARATGEQIDELTTRLTELRQRIDPTTQDFRELTQQLGTLGRQTERRAPGADFLTRRLGPRGGRAVSEGLVGGAFPLLFGQGVGAAVGGGLGGAAGGFAGGNLGFGLSLVGTAAGTAIDTLIQKSGELASALAKPAENFDKLKEILFISSKGLEKQIEKSKEYGNEVAVSTAIQEEAIAKLGLNGVGNLSRLEAESDKANRAFAELGQQLQAVVAGPVAGVTAFFGDVAKRAAAGGRVQNIRASLTGDQRKIFEDELLDRVQKNGAPRGFFGGEASQGEIGVLADQGQLQDILDKWSDVSIKGRIKITNEEELRTQANSLQKFTEAQQSQLSVFDIPKGTLDQIKSASRQQEDLDRQRFDLLESYEKSLSDIRLGVEKQITQERLANVQKENESLRVQGDIRLQQLKNANLDLKQSLFGNEFGQRLSDIVSSFTEQQLSAENEIANRRKNLEFELQSKAVQVEEFKVGVAKQISDLNSSTEKQIAQIKLSTLRQSQDYDQKRFALEKQINITRLRYELVISKQKRAEAIEQLKIEKDPARIDILSKQAQIYTDLGREIPNLISQLESASPPGKISFATPRVGGSASTAGFDALAQRGKQLSTQIVSLQEQFDSLARQNNIKQLNADLSQLADQGVSQLSNDFETLSSTLQGGNSFDFAARQVSNAFEKILKGKGVIESVFSQQLPMLIRLYGELAQENLKLAESFEFFNQIGQDLAEKLKSVKEEINSLLAGTTEYERVLFQLSSRGISPASEEFQKLARAAEEVDRLNQKVEVLNTFKTAASEMSGSVRGLVEDLIELGDASQAAANFADRLGKKALGFVLDIGFKPIEKAMQDAFVQFAGKLGFDITPEEQKQLEAIDAIRQSVATIEREIAAYFAKIPQVTMGEGLTDTQKQLIRDMIGSQMNGTPNASGQPVRAEENSSSAAKLEVVSYEEAQKTIDNLNKVGEGVQGLSAKGVEAAAQINAASAQASSAIEVSGKQVNAAIPAWGASLGKVVTGLSGAIAGISGISGGMMMVGGGTYETLMGLSSIFGGIASAAGAFGSLSGLGNAAKGFSGGYFDPKTGLGAAGPNFGFAKGGMFSNSIVSSPTLFKFANGGITRNGLMGEAGPEAIIPLSRGADGRLGVDATGFSDAISEARDALDEASGAMAQGDGATGLELASGASDGYGGMGLRPGEAQGKMSRTAAMAISDSRGAVEMIKRITQENDAKAAAAAASASPETRELYKLLATKDSNTIREITNNQTGSADGTDQFAAGSQQQLAYGDAISAARGVLASEISGGEPDQMQQMGEAGAITNSREFIEKITDRISSPDSSKKAEASAFGDSRNAVGKSSGSQSAISTKETISAFMQARDSKETSSAISQTREVLSSVSSMNKEKNMERVMESNATAVTKPLDIKYESQVINSVEYVTVEQHQRGLSQAAERGRALALNSLKNSVKARRQVGI